MSLTPRFPVDVIPPPPTPPVPVSAVYDALSGKMTVTFDEPIVEQGLDPRNWVIDPGGFEADEATVLPPTQVELLFPPEAGPHQVEYLADPADVIGEAPHDAPVVAFTFPVT